MTTGALIFAYNNETVDYLSMAAWSASNIHRHLDIPVCLVTDSNSADLKNQFDQVIVVDSPITEQKRYFRDYQAAGTWFNTNRVSAHDLTPWDQTLLLDADYVVASDQLGVLLDLNQDFLAHNRADDISGNLSFRGNATFGTYCMPMSWATVVCFRKSKTSELIFHSMEMIRNNWNHYLELYHVGDRIYRNDYALSIAMNMVDGHGLTNPVIPWSLATVTPETKLTQLDQDIYRIDYRNNEDKPKWITLRQDFHAMCKRDLGEIVANSS
jgi:hypothetical protein